MLSSLNVWKKYVQYSRHAWKKESSKRIIWVCGRSVLPEFRNSKNGPTTPVMVPIIEFKSNRNSKAVVESWFFRFKSWVQSVFQAVETKIKECVRSVLNFFQPEEMQEHIRSVSRFVQAEETQENMRGIVSFLQAQETHELFTLLGSLLWPDSSSLLHRGTGLRTGQTSGLKSSVRPATKVRPWGLGSKSSGLRQN